MLVQSLEHGFRTGCRQDLQLFVPQTSIGMERHEQCPLNTHQTGRHHWNELQKTVEVGETAQSEAQRHEQFLIGPLLLRQAVEQLTQRCGCRRGRQTLTNWRSRMAP